MPKRFSTQMYLYMLPLSTRAAGAPEHEAIIPTPTHDGGLEHTAATFDDANAWLEKAKAGEIVLFPPQYFLLHLVSEFLEGPPTKGQTDEKKHYQRQREDLLEFVHGVPTVRFEDEINSPSRHATGDIPWGQKVMSPSLLFIRKSDKRIVLGLDKPGPELKGTGRGGDWDRVVLVHFKKDGPKNVEVRWRRDVLKEEKEMEQESEKGAKL